MLLDLSEVLNVWYHLYLYTINQVPGICYYWGYGGLYTREPCQCRSNLTPTACTDGGKGHEQSEDMGTRAQPMPKGTRHPRHRGGKRSILSKRFIGLVPDKLYLNSFMVRGCRGGYARAKQCKMMRQETNYCRCQNRCMTWRRKAHPLIWSILIGFMLMPTCPTLIVPLAGDNHDMTLPDSVQCRCQWGLMTLKRKV